MIKINKDFLKKSKHLLLKHPSKVLVSLGIASLLSVSIFPQYSSKLSGTVDIYESFFHVGFSNDQTEEYDGSSVKPNTLKSSVVPTAYEFDTHVSYQDVRVSALQKYLEQRGSPTAPYAYLYIELADKYNVPWILMPAIGEAETHSCTHKEDYNTNSPSAIQKNCWGIGGGPATRINFETWEGAIEFSIKLIAENYGTGHISMVNIQRKYCGLGCVEDVWARRVMFYVDRINAFMLENGGEEDLRVTL